MRDQSQQKKVYWIGTARGDLRRFPEELRYAVGYALYVAQTGGKHDRAKPLRGFGNAGVAEIVEEHDGNTYRAVYTVRFKVQRGDLRSARFSEEVQEGHRHTET